MTYIHTDRLTDATKLVANPLCAHVMNHDAVTIKRMFVIVCACSSLVLQNWTEHKSDLYYVYNGNSSESAGVMASFITR